MEPCVECEKLKAQIKTLREALERLKIDLEEIMMAKDTWKNLHTEEAIEKVEKVLAKEELTSQQEQE